MITYNRYLNQEDHVWYDSSNIIYSKCYDSPNSKEKRVKIVFKGGRTYLYTNVDGDDYLRFKASASNGEGFNKYIKKYNTLRLADTDIAKLDKLMEDFKKDINELNDKKVGELAYVIEIEKDTKEFVIKLGDKILFRGVEGNFSIMDLLTSLNIFFSVHQVDKLENNSDELLDKIEV